MKHALAVLATLAFATPAFAQGTPAPAPAPAAPESAAPAPTPATPPAAIPPAPGPGGVKAIMQGCRGEADSQGLKGAAKFDAVSACVVRQRPDLAGRMDCRKQGFDKGLRKEELHAFVKQCLSGKD